MKDNNKKKMRGSISIVTCGLCLSILCLFASCIKTLEDEGIYENTLCVGTLINNQDGTPAAGMKVSKTNGTSIPVSVKCDENGYFSIEVSVDEVRRDYYLKFDADSLYSLNPIQLDKMPFGSANYDMGKLKVQGPTPPTVKTAAPTNVKSNSAVLNGEVAWNGNLNVTARGICYSTSPNPTTNGAHTTEGTGEGEYHSEIQGLWMNTTYYVRAYAINRLGTSYGEQIEFTTDDGLPTVTTLEPSVKSATTAEAGGTITDDGGFQISAYGVCWSTHENPTIQNPHTNDGNMDSEFRSSITGIDASTTYYVRAYATNIAGTAYGEQFKFTTDNGLPVVVTAKPDAAKITATTAVLGGNLKSDGGYTLLARGVCYGTTHNPTISDPHTTDGCEEGAYESFLVNLVEGTTYYARAYATNIIGTVYGDEVEFVAKDSKTNDNKTK